MSDYKIKNREALLSHGDARAKAQVLELTERVLHRLDARKRLHEMMHREGGELVIGPPPRSEPVPSCVRFSSGKAGNHMARAFEDLLGGYRRWASPSSRSGMRRTSIERRRSM